MPPKRKAASPTPMAVKKLRIGNTSTAAESSGSEFHASGRPKRESLSEPQYNFARPRAPAVKSTQTDVVKRGPGRPRKNAVAGAPTATKRRAGRPRKAATAHAAVATLAKPPNARKAIAATTPSTNLGDTAPKKRGRPKAATANAEPAARSKPTPAAKSKRNPAAKSKPTPVAKSKPTPAAKNNPTSAAKNKANPATKTTAAIVSADPSVWDENNIEGGVIENGMGGMEGGDDRQYWLMKAEPMSRIEKGKDVKFSIDDLMAKTVPEGWDGVRNFVARNNMRAMRKGDLAFFYHSNCPIPGIAGVMQIVQEHSIDESAFDPHHPYYDPKSTRDKPKWEVVHVQFVRKFDELVTLKELRSFSTPGGALADMTMLKQSRLSVSPVSPKEWEFILTKLAGEEPEDLVGGEEDDPLSELATNGDADEEDNVEGLAEANEQLNGELTT